MVRSEKFERINGIKLKCKFYQWLCLLAKFAASQPLPVIKYITLTTDYGLSDPYVAAVKGQLYRQLPGVQLVDVAHNISKYNLQQAAYALKNAYHFFPDGSLHLLDVSSTHSDKAEFILFAFEGHYFVTPDNGICALITENAALKPFIVPQGGRPHAYPFSLLSDVLPALQPFLMGEKPELLYGEAISSYQELTHLLPVSSSDNLQGRVVYVDSYENVITNIDRNTFKKWLNKGDNYTIHLRKRRSHENQVTRLVNSYEDVQLTDIACFFGHNNLLQIAIRGGNASGLLGLKIGDPIYIEKI